MHLSFGWTQWLHWSLIVKGWNNWAWGEGGGGQGRGRESPVCNPWSNVLSSMWTTIGHLLSKYWVDDCGRLSEGITRFPALASEAAGGRQVLFQIGLLQLALAVCFQVQMFNKESKWQPIRTEENKVWVCATYRWVEFNIWWMYYLNALHLDQIFSQFLLEWFCLINLGFWCRAAAVRGWVFPERCNWFKRETENLS